MPAQSILTSPVEQHLLKQLGERLRLTRTSQEVSAVELAARVGISRTTLRGIENGDPSATIGSYVRVLSALGVVADLALVATGASKEQAPLSDAQVRQAPLGSLHQAQDLQSRLMHEEAVRMLRSWPTLSAKLLATLERWKQREDPNSLPLRERWELIIKAQDWEAALADTDEAQQLRQASPLPTLLPEHTRMRIIGEVKAMKERCRATA